MGTFGPLWAAGAVAAGVAIGYLLAAPQRRRLCSETRRLGEELSRLEVQTREHNRQAIRLRNEQRTTANFLRLLPGAVQALNRERLDARAIPRLILDLATAIFEPEQIALYLVRQADKSDGSPERLHLVDYRGLSKPRGSLESIAFGEGKVGWVASHRVDMTIEDWLNPTKTDGSPPADNDPALRPDLMSPLLYHAEKDTETLGVLCIGRPAVRLRDEKLMLQMITNLGSIALTHARYIHGLKSRANHDGLTGLTNKKHFMESLAYMINNAEKELQPIGVFIFDIDHFKHYNDSNGHLAGDQLLKRLSSLIRENLRPGDLACRYGGEEFVVAMPDTDGAVAEAAAERIRAAIEGNEFPHGASQPMGRLTISGGVAAFPVDGTNGTELISHADQALYRAKAAGRNRVLRYRGVDIGKTPGNDCQEEVFHPTDPGLVW